ncbi:hypothetical protein ACLUXD_11105 [Loigolactobacillus coryniformis subsp. coryniformis]|uniref:hypothetical protein n=1 Tax=Loigolactobacillus coryniformis TaxID=1610 RepID=UPI00201A31F7|nr:hypothetical protein [Loigolactobacillus coryniformis]MCL5459095.1 hypothetical protein [Loigolactobacillus coryniformis]
MTDYLTQIKELATGEREQIEVKQADFYAFRRAWLEFPQRKSIVGEAQRGGDVIYHFEKATEQ